MIGYLVLGICLLLAFLLARNWLINANPGTLARVLRYGAVGLLGLGGAACVLTGRFAFGIPLLALAAVIYRGASLPSWSFPSAARPETRKGQTSQVDTEYLSMTLEHDSGVMAGRVLRGAYAGKNLAELTLEQLVALLSECHRHDAESAHLLETYLDRTLGPDWRDAAQAAQEKQQGRARRGWGRNAAGAAPMSPDEAREILGVGNDASSEDVKEAYRRLMQKLHPDQGGSTYLAAKINQAKDVLLDV